MTFIDKYTKEEKALEDIRDEYLQECKDAGLYLWKYQTLDAYIKDNYEVKNGI